MTDAHALVPKDKCDGSHIEELKRLSDGEIEPILPRLLAWTQDVHWPVSAGRLQELRKGPTALRTRRPRTQCWRAVPCGWILPPAVPGFGSRRWR